MSLLLLCFPEHTVLAFLCPLLTSDIPLNLVLYLFRISIMHVSFLTRPCSFLYSELFISSSLLASSCAGVGEVGGQGLSPEEWEGREFREWRGITKFLLQL